MMYAILGGHFFTHPEVANGDWSTWVHQIWMVCQNLRAHLQTYFIRQEYIRGDDLKPVEIKIKFTLFNMASIHGLSGWGELAHGMKCNSEVLCLSSVTASVRAEFLLWYLSQSQSVTPAVCEVEVSCLFSLPMAVSALCHAGMESKNRSKWSDISKCHPRSERRVGWCWLLRWFGAARWEEHMWRLWSLSLRSFAASDGIYIHTANISISPRASANDSACQLSWAASQFGIVHTGDNQHWSGKLL